MPKKKPATKTPVPVETIKHKDTRKNIPTEELRNFLDDSAPLPPKLYPRDPSLDPQLVWKGKDELDSKPLEVPVVPIYIQEKIHPRAIIDDLKSRQPQSETTEKQLDLFADFNGIDTFDKKVDFYHHDQHWSNRMILGDSLAVMTSLAEKEGLKGQVQTIYFDPPYGIKFGSNWQVSTRKRDVKDGKAEDASRQPEQVCAFRDTWQFGIHSYLAVIRDRMVAARDLLTESGSFFVQIGEENVHLVRAIMDEVFGSENFVSLITFRTTANLVGKYIGRNSDYLLWFSKRIDSLKYRQLYEERTISDDIGGRYTRYELPNGDRRVMNPGERNDNSQLPKDAMIYRHDNLTSQGATQKGTVWVDFEGKSFHPGNSRHWTTSLDGLKRLNVARRLAAPTENSLAYVRYMKDFPVGEFTNVWTDTQTGAFTDDKVYVVQTNAKVIERCLLMTTDPGDLVLDPTCGSGTTVYMAEQWGRRWITIDTSRVALALARTRMMAARFPYYLLSDSSDGRKKAQEIGVAVSSSSQATGDIKKGFVYKRVPHVTLKSIANNPDIKEGMTRSQIEAAIAKHADTELLYDKPYEDNSRVRVTGPFTVESLSPHRRLTVEQKRARASGKNGIAVRVIGPDQFGSMIIDNLRKAGIQARDKKERLKFDVLEPFAGEWLHAAGEFTDANGDSKRVAVCIGPEHGTVGADLVREAAKEAMRGAGFDMLYVMGFSFDPQADRDKDHFGKLKVQICRMNPDLSMGDELLKKTGAGNLFMVFGEPDI